VILKLFSISLTNWESAAVYDSFNLPDGRHELQATINRAKTSIEAAQQRQQAYYNQNLSEITFEPKQFVLLSTRNFSQGRGQKLKPKWIGPFQVNRMIGPVAVKLNLPDTMKCHNVFHVSLVKPYKCREGEEPQVCVPPIEFDTDGTPIWQVERVVNRCTLPIRKGN